MDICRAEYYWAKNDYSGSGGSHIIGADTYWTRLGMRMPVFATQSTHKLLAALSQASYIPVINGKKPIEHSRFNESYMLQSTTSPLYAIIAANEVGAAMMEGDQGGGSIIFGY